MENVVLTHLTVPEVRELFRQELEIFFRSHRESFSHNSEKNLPDRLSREQALKFLSEQGVTISESHLYKLTAAKQIPFEYFGRKLIFSRKELISWIETQTTDPGDNSEIELSLAKSARRKRERRLHA